MILLWRGTAQGLAGRTEVFVLDPPDNDKDEDHPKTEPPKKVSERTGERTWRVDDPERFRQRSVIAEESNLLKWAGQFQTAAVRDQRLEGIQPELMAMPNIPLQTRNLDFGTFRGFDQLLFPALSREIRLFTGVDDALLESVIADRPHRERDRRLGMEERANQRVPDHLPANASVSSAGTCMIIEGLWNWLGHARALLPETLMERHAGAFSGLPNNPTKIDTVSG